jgi:hypothetical protein
LESVLAGGNGDGGTQLRPDGGSASSLAGEQLAVAMVEQHWLSTALGSKFVIFVYIRPFFHSSLQFGLLTFHRFRNSRPVNSAYLFNIFKKCCVVFSCISCSRFSSELSL